MIQQEDTPKNVKFYLDIGTHEWAGKPAPLTDALGRPYTYPFIWVDGADAVFNALEINGVPAENLLLVVDEGGEHEAADWNSRFAEAVLWLWEERVIAEKPNLVTVIPPEKAIIVQTPTARAVAATTPTAEAEIHVQGAARLPERLILFVTGLGLLLIAGFILIHLKKRYFPPKQ